MRKLQILLIFLHIMISVICCTAKKSDGSDRFISFIESRGIRTDNTDVFL